MTSPVMAVGATFPDRACARKVADMLLQQKLVASVHLIGPIEATYWWRDRLEQAAEIQMTAKTLADAVPAVRALIEAHHPYTLPEITAVPFEAAPDYVQWVARYSSGPDQP